MMCTTSIRLAECFESINGEGALTGIPTYFARFAGCSVSTCPLHPYKGGCCDTDWHYQLSKTPEEIADEAQRSRLPWLCITGGEPFDQQRGLYALIQAAHERGLKVTVQTSGVRECDTERFDWLVVSPKVELSSPHLRQRRGHELKLLNCPPMVPNCESLVSWACRTRFSDLCLQPVWRKDGTSNAVETAKMIQSAAEIGAGPWRLSLQQHKFWGGR